MPEHLARFCSGTASASPLAGLSGASASASSMGGGGARRLVVFVIGGVTRSEMRAAHEAAAALGRDVVLASTDVLRPDVFLHQLAELGPHDM